MYAPYIHQPIVYSICTLLNSGLTAYQIYKNLKINILTPYHALPAVRNRTLCCAFPDSIDKVFFLTFNGSKTQVWNHSTI